MSGYPFPPLNMGYPQDARPSASPIRTPQFERHVASGPAYSFSPTHHAQSHSSRAFVFGKGSVGGQGTETGKQSGRRVRESEGERGREGDVKTTMALVLQLIESQKQRWRERKGEAREEM